MKKIIAICLAVVLAITSIIIFPGRGGDGFIDLRPGVQAAERTFSPVSTVWERPELMPLQIDEALQDQSPRDGYILAPTLFGLTGIDTASSFVLRTSAGYDAEPLIFIDGQPQPYITREDNNTFIITPLVALTPNSVYIFSLVRSGSPDITWAFQTTVRFEITSTLPRHHSVNIPVRSGIEIEFSSGENIEIEEHFSIYPHVAGRFIHRDSTAVFMPTEALMDGQIYTVTISAGIGLPNTSEIITTDYVFSFETAPTDAQLASSGRASNIHFSSRHVEFPLFAAPSVNFWLNYNRDTGRPPIDMAVYRIDDRAQAIADANRLISTPGWSMLAQTEQLVDTSRLSRVYSSRVYESVVDDDSWWWGRNEVFTLSTNLPLGFYVVEATTEYSHSQMIVQITDTAVQIVADNDRTLAWINDMRTGAPMAGARVYDPISGRTYEASTYGIAVMDRMLLTGEHLIVSATDGRQSVIFTDTVGFGGGWSPRMPTGWGHGPRQDMSARDNYWTALQLDRTLFQRNDTVSLWGFVQNRHQNENITHVTAVLTQRSWWWDEPERDTLHTQNIGVAGGAYSGEIRLPHLDPGNYEIAIFHGDILLSSMFFSVMDYVTPPYQLNVTASASAIFAGEEVVFSARAEFFEGTPVPDLNVSYSFHGWDLTVPGRGQERTNREGDIEISTRPTVISADAQGERSIWFEAEATLPEIGLVFESTHVRVFTNDIHVRPRATREGSDASLTINVNDITLERINDGSAQRWDDFLCEPVAGRTLSVEIIELYWERIREGERYDHVTRQVVPWYRHEQRTNIIDRFEITTDSDGIAEREFQVPNHENRSYQARISTMDGNGRRIVQYVFIGRDFSRFFWSVDDDSMFLDGVNPDGYDIGDEVKLTIMRGMEPVAQGNFLFVVVQNNIMSYHIGTNPLSFTFGEQHVPNAQVFAFHFNGHTYYSGWRMSERLRFNTESRTLDIEIITCLETYRPGDMATFTVTTTDMHGNRVPANVNISIVDEALFALMDYTVDTLAMLYGNVSDSLRVSMATHSTFVSDGIEFQIDLDDASWHFRTAQTAGAPAPAAAPSMALMAEASEERGAQNRIRERFEDTASFMSGRTNSQGEATFTFQLPDNITSWRVTASAISNDLYAGNTVQNVRVTQPMFVHYTLNSTFLAGDRPYVGVNVYGTSFSGGEQVAFEVWREGAPDDIRTATGAAFERVNIPLWEKASEGTGAIIIRATAGGYSDAIQHTYRVIGSHRQVDMAVFYEVTPDTVFEVNHGGLTNITFTDRGRGQFLTDLFTLRNAWWRSGARIEGLVARREATALIKAHFPEALLFGGVEDFDALEYQTLSGGIAILPYAEADLQTTVMLLPFIKDDVNLAALTGYLRNVFDTSDTDNKMLALYGLAILGEPVLLDLQSYAMLSDLSVRNAAYVALGLVALGETQAARGLYIARIEPHVQRVGAYYRIDLDMNRAETLDATSASALIAAQLGMRESVGLHGYAARYRFDASNRNDALVMGIERLVFISHEIENHTDTAASITYTLFGETTTRELGAGGQFNLRIPAQNMHEFNLISTTGEVGAVSIVRMPLEDMEMLETDIVILREFFRAGEHTPTNTFAQGDLVRVQITINYSARDLSGSYAVTDFLPAGLVHVANSARFGEHDSAAGRWAWAKTEGARITFFDFNSRANRTRTYFYYARVINPGTFTAEGTLVQSVGAREYMAVGEGAVLTIRP